MESSGPNISLGHRQRPLTFDGILGRTEVVDVLRDQLASNRLRSILLYGPTGCGKTTVAEIYAKGILCESPTHRPCSEPACKSCQSFEASRPPHLHSAHQNYQEVICRDKQDGEAIAALNSDVFSQSLSGGRKVFLIDDLHNLARQGFDDLHHRLERPADDATFIMCTSDLAVIPERVRSACPNYRIAPLTMPARRKLLSNICDRTGQRYDDDNALELIAENAGIDTRSLIRDLEMICSGGPITYQRASAFYKINTTDAVESYLMAVLRRFPVRAQIAVMDDWLAEPAEKVVTIERYLAMLMSSRIMRLKSNTGGFVSHSPSADAIVQLIAERTAVASMSEIAYWSTLARHWRNGFTTTQDSLLVMMFGFEDLLNGSSYRVETADSIPESLKPQSQRPRSTKQVAFSRMSGPSFKSETKAANYLPIAKAFGLWEAASFMVQVYGVVLNTHIMIGYKQPETQRITKLLSALTHELRPLLRPAKRKGRRPQLNVHTDAPTDAFHWLYSHENSQSLGFCTHLVVHVPDSAGDVEDWIRNSLLKRHLGLGPEDVTLRVRRAASNTKKGYWYHLELLRLLCRGIDPNRKIAVQGSDKKYQEYVADLLGIPTRIREPRGVTLDLKPCGWAQTIGDKARRKLKEERFAALSTVDVNTKEAWADTSGWELVEHEHRQREAAEREARQSSIEEMWPAGVDSETDNKCKTALAGLRASWPEDALLRLRTSSGWWKTAGKRPNLERKTTRGRRS